jgi:sRNA-binding carbon storage regulator CsrA
MGIFVETPESVEKVHELEIAETVQTEDNSSECEPETSDEE